LLKRISTKNLRIGMYVDEFCGSWMEHPFWRAHFQVMDEVQLARIRGSGVTELWIDSSKGLDVADSAAANDNRASADARVERQLKGMAVAAERKARQREDIDGELEKASRIFRESRKVVGDMFAQARMGNVRNVEAAHSVVDSIVTSVSRHPTALIGLARLKSVDDYTFMHSMAVSALMVSLARTLELDEERTRVAGMAGLLHDMGKAQVPAAILNKTGNLNDEEWNTMRAHPERGYAMLQGTAGITAEILDAVLHHHEKIDGTGYPHKLTGDRITDLAKMAAMCDVYDAITSDRPYKPGWQPTIAVRKMTEWVGHFDEALFQAFVRTVGIYPIGSLVRLKSQRLAVVVDHDPMHLLQPTVKAFFSLRSKVYIEPTLIRLTKDNGSDRIVSFENPAAHGITRMEDIWIPSTADIAA